MAEGLSKKTIKNQTISHKKRGAEAPLESSQ